MFYVLDEKGNRVEAFDKQGYLNFLQQAIENGDLAGIDAESAFVSKLKCCVGGQTYQLAFVTEAVYNQLKENNQLKLGILYFITDDTSYDILVDAINDIIKGKITVPSAENSTKVNGLEIVRSPAGVLKIGDVIIPQKKLLWSGEETDTIVGSGVSSSIEIDLGKDLTNKTLEIEVLESVGSTSDIAHQFIKYKVITPQSKSNSFVFSFSDRVRVNIYCLESSKTKLSFRFETTTNVPSAYTSYVGVYKIYEIIE